MEPTKYYGRSRFIGVEPFATAAPPAPNVSVEAMEQCRDECIALIEKYWPPFWGAAGAGSNPTTLGDALTAEDLSVMALMPSRASGDVKAYLSDESISGVSPYRLWRLFLFEDTNQASAATGGLTDPPFAMGAKDQREQAGFHVTLQYAVLGRVANYALNEKMDPYSAQHIWLLKSLKSHFQRPRPFQCAVDFTKYFFVFPSESAWHPALPAGHSMQGAHRAATLLMEHGGDWKKYKSQLAAWAAAMSDRRIDCGLHFPADALAGWAVAKMFGRLTWPRSVNESDDFFHAVIEQSEMVQLLRAGRTRGQFPVLNQMLNEVLAL